MSALPRHSSCSIVPIPMPFSSPISIPGAVLENLSLVLVSKAALGACSTPFSRLLQPSVRGVVDLGVMAFGHHPLPSLLFVDVSHFQLGSIPSMLPVGESGRLLASFDLREAYIPVPVHPASRPFLRFLFRDTVYQFQALYFGLSTAPQVFPGSWLLFQLYSIPGYPYASIPRHLAGPVFLSGVSPRGSSTCPPALSSFLGLSSIPGIQPHTFPGSAVSVGRLRFHLFQGFSVGGMHLLAAICNRRIYVMRLAYREPVAVASRRSFFASSPSSGRLAFFLRWLGLLPGGYLGL